MVRRGAVLTLLALALAWAAPLSAQQTGSISGVVFDQTGLPVPGALVKVSGDKLPGGRTFTTGESGAYQFPALLPGTYTVEVSKVDIGTTSQKIVVEVDRVATVDVVLGVTIQESIDVAATLSAVDQKKTEVNFNYNAEEIGTLPLDRSYRGLLQLIPGVADNRSTVGPAAGGSRQDNTYLVDGVNITNPGFGTLNVEVNELDIAEVNVKRAGVTAEFGRSAGVVTNAVTKSGTNRLSGTARVDWLPQELIGDFKDDAFRDPLLTTVVSPAVGVGGPFIKDRLFWYGSARYFETTNWDRVNKLGTPLPDEDRTGHELNGKVTATLGPRHLINVGYRDRPNERKNSGLGSSTSPPVGTNDDLSSRIATATWNYFVTPRSIVEARYLYMKEKNESVPLTDLGYKPQPFDVNDLAAMGYYTDPTQANVVFGGAEYTNTQDYRRHEFRAAYTQYLDFGGTTHEIKGGFGYEFGDEELDRLSNGWGSISNITVSGRPVVRARYYFEQPAQLGEGRTWSVFVQDTATIGQRLTVNAGLLLNQDEFAQNLEGSNGCPANLVLTGGAAVYESDGDRCAFLRFAFGDEIQPRLGANYVLRKEAGDKVYANWGRYYNMDQKSSGRSLAPRRIYQYEARFDAVTGALISDLPRLSTTGKQIDPDLKPTYNDEYLVGYATPFRSYWSVDVFYVYRNTDQFIEDVPTVLPDTGPYAAANLPCARFAACQPADAERIYKSFNVEVSRRLFNKWSMAASYAYTSFKGNFDLDYSGEAAVFNTSSYIQDGPGTNVEEPNRYGPLRQERPHVFKLFGSWMPLSAVTLGGYFRVQSGTPWNARGQDWEGGAALHYLEPAGTHRNPTWTNLDLLGNYTFRFRGNTALILEARLLNVFGNQTVLSTDSVQYLEANTIDVPPWFGPDLDPNPFYGTPNSYAPPRRLVLAARFNF